MPQKRATVYAAYVGLFDWVVGVGVDGCGGGDREIRIFHMGLFQMTPAIHLWEK